MNPFKTDEWSKIVSKSLGKSMGTSVAIISDGEVLYESYFGEINTNVPNQESSYMMIGSNTKILTTIAVMQLVEQNRIHLDDDINKYIKELDIPSRFGKAPIKIRDILYHRSGIASDDYDFLTNKKLNLEDAVEILNATPLAYKPGTMYAYSNLAFGLLGVLIQRISKLSYEEYIKKNITDPLGLSIFISDDIENHSDTKNISRSFNKKGKIVIDPLSTILSAGSNTYAKLSDMKALLNFFLHPENQSVLSKESIKMMMESPSKLETHLGEVHHGLGLMFNQISINHDEIMPVIGHGGDTIYHHSKFIMIPKQKLGITIMTNSENGAKVASRILNRAIKHWMKFKEMKPKSFPPSTIVDSDDDISGLFALTGSLVSIKHKSKINTLKMGPFKLKLSKMTNGRYKSTPTGISKIPMFKKQLQEIEWEVNEKNGAKLLSVHQTMKNKFAYGTIGTSFVKAPLTESAKSLVGKYKLVNDNLPLQKLIKSLNVTIKYDLLKCTIDMGGIKMKLYLNQQSENSFTALGYGRNSGNTITYEIRPTTTIYLMGCVFKKI